MVYRIPAQTANALHIEDDATLENLKFGTLVLIKGQLDQSNTVATGKNQRHPPRT